MLSLGGAFGSVGSARERVARPAQRGKKPQALSLPASGSRWYLPSIFTISTRGPKSSIAEVTQIELLPGVRMGWFSASCCHKTTRWRRCTRCVAVSCRLFNSAARKLQLRVFCPSSAEPRPPSLGQRCPPSLNGLATVVRPYMDTVELSFPPALEAMTAQPAGANESPEG